MFETALIKGSVEITSPELSQSLRLKPDEIAVANNGRLETSHISDYNYFKWKEGLFCFENESIQDLIDKLQLYYDIQIDVQRPSLLQYRYSGKFRIKDGVEHVLKVLQLKHKFTYTKEVRKRFDYNKINTFIHYLNQYAYETEKSINSIGMKNREMLQHLPAEVSTELSLNYLVLTLKHTNVWKIKYFES